MSLPADFDDAPEPWFDPIVAEVRATRERIFEAAGGTVEALEAHRLRRQAALVGRVVLDPPADADAAAERAARAATNSAPAA